MSIQKIHPTLHEEILEFEKKIHEYNLENKDICEEIVQQIRSIVAAIFPDLTLQLYGSFATGLCMPFSDIDLVIVDQNNNEIDKDHVLVEQVKNLQIQSKFFEEIKYISGATIPLQKVNCTKKYLCKKVDITIQDGKHNGIACVSLVKEYLETYDVLTFLALPLKQLQYYASLNDPYQGGLSSYGLIQMIVSFLQWKIFNKEDISQSCKPILGNLLVDFLSFYSSISYETTEIKPFNPNLALEFPPFIKKNFQQVSDMNGISMLITDPLNSSNNVARSTHKFAFIKNIFYNGFFSSLQVCPCEMRILSNDDKELNDINKDILNTCTGQIAYVERKYILKKILNSAKYFNILNYNNSKSNLVQS